MSLVKILIMLVIGLLIYILGFCLMAIAENKKASIPLMIAGAVLCFISILIFWSGEYVLN